MQLGLWSRAVATRPGVGGDIEREWLLEAGLAEQRGGELVATELGLALGAALDDLLAVLSS